MNGELVGINSAIISRTGGNVGIGFAVPIDTAKQIAQELIDKGQVNHAFLGISGADLSPDIADALNLDVNHGALVQSVVPGSPADKAGLSAGNATASIDGARVSAGGDVITQVDGKDVQMRLLREHNIEVGGGLGPDAPDIWRIGMMGTNAHTETADRLLEAFDSVLEAPREGVSAGRA